MEIKLKGTVDEVDKALKELGYFSPKIGSKITRTIASKLKSRIKRGVYSYLKKGKGDLRNSVQSKNYRNGTSVVYLAGTKANALEYGAKIFAKDKKYLSFSIKGKWLKKQSVEIKGRHYFYPLGESFLNSPEYNFFIESILDKEVDRLWKQSQ